MKKSIVSLTFAVCMASTLIIPYNIENVSASIKYQSDVSTARDEIFISASSVVEIVNEDRSYLSFAYLTGMGEILSVKERPDSDEEFAALIKAEKRNIHYCYIESEDCIVNYNYNTGEFSKTDYSIEAKYTIDLVNKKFISKTTDESFDISNNFKFSAIDGRYIREMIYYDPIGFMSPAGLPQPIPETESSAFTCNSNDIVKVVREDEEALYFADQTGLGRILVLDEKPATDEELIAAIKEPKLNIHFCYLEKEKEMIYYNYNDNSLSKTENQMEIKYTIDLVKMNIVDNSNDDVVLNFNETSGYWVVNEKNEKKEMILAGYNFISPTGYLPAELPEKTIGDINDDGEIDLSDLTMMSQYILKDIELTASQIKCADVNVDAEVNLQDLALLKQFVMHDDVQLGLSS